MPDRSSDTSRTYTVQLPLPAARRELSRRTFHDPALFHRYIAVWRKAGFFVGFSSPTSCYIGRPVVVAESFA